MQTIITNFLNGPFKNEAEFKKAMLAKLSKEFPSIAFFEIENEEKSSGMPDILACSYGEPAVWTEVKYVGKDGMVKFQPSQPLWYKRNHLLRIQILAWDSRTNEVVYVPPEDVVKAKSLTIPVAKLAGEIDFEVWRVTPETKHE